MSKLIGEQYENNMKDKSMMKRGCKRTVMKKGSITVFLSLVMFCLLELFMVLLEGGRVEVMEYRAKEMGQVSLDSAFAGFVRPVFDRYGIFIYWGQCENLEKEINTYIVNNLPDQGDRINDFFKMESTGVKVTEYTNITNENGEEMAKQAQEVMKYSLGGKAAEKLLEQCTKLQKGKDTQELFEEIEQEGENIVSVQEELSKVYNCVNKISSLKSNPRETAEDLLLILKKEKNNLAVSLRVEKQITRAYKKLKKSWAEHNKACENLNKAIQNYNKKEHELKKSVSQLENRLKEEGKTYRAQGLWEEYVLTQADIQVDRDNNAVGGNKNDSRKEIDNLEKQAQEYMKNLESCRQFLENDAQKEIYLQYDNYYQSVKFMCEELSDFEQTIPTMEKKQSNDELKGFQRLLKNIKKCGLSLVVTDTKQISSKEASMKNLPSYTEKYKKGNRKIDIQKIVFGQYCIEHFGNYTEQQKNTVLSYELEYLLGGKASDQENLEWVVRALLPIRAGFNALHILKSPKKMGEAGVLAVSLCGWTGIPGLSTLTKYILIQVWAYGESVIDVRDLLEGKKVPMLKTEGQWTLGLSGIKGISGKTKSCNAGDRGLNYKSYIRFLLAIQQKGIQYYRCMDLIQMNINKMESSFLMKHGIVYAKATVSFYAQPLFLNFTGFGGKKEKYSIQEENSRRYE